MENKLKNNKKDKYTPPRWMDRILEWFCSHLLIEGIQGDLHELYKKWIEKKGSRRAKWHYFFNVILFFRPFTLQRKKTYYKLNHIAMYNNFFLTSFRQLIRNKLFSFINLISLAIGILFCILVYIFLKNELTFDRFHGNADRIYRVIGHYPNPEGDYGFSAFQDHKFVQIFTENIPGVLRASAFQTAGDIWIKNGEDIYKEKVGFVDSTFLLMFSFPWLAGNRTTALDNLNNIVISRETADRFFGKPKVGYDEYLGRIIVFPKGKEKNFIVTGILGTIPKNSSMTFDMLVPYVNNEPYPHSNDFFGMCSIYLELRPEASINSVTSAANALVNTYLKDKIDIADKYYAGFDRKFEFDFQMQPLKDIYLNTSIDSAYESHGNPKYIYVLGSIALLVIIISSINYILLTTGRSLVRLKEFGIRKVLGGGNIIIIKQFIVEALVNTMFATIIGLLLAKILIPVFNRLVQRNLSFDILHWDIILFLSGILLVVSIIVGIVPALNVSRLNPVRIFKQQVTMGSRNRYSRIFIVLQYSLSMILIVSTLIIVHQLKYLQNRDPGFDQHNVVTVSLPDDLSGTQINTLQNEMAAEANIVSVANSDRNFIAGSQTVSLKNAEGQYVRVRRLRIDPGYISTLGIPLVAGRNISGSIASDTMMAVLVNETMVKAMGWKDPIGQVVPDDNYDPDKRPVVVGVVKDFHFDSMRDKIEPLMMSMNPGWNSIWNLFVRINPKNPGGAIASIKSVWESILPDRPLNYTYLEESLVNQYGKEDRWSRIVGYSAILAIIISSMGLFGLTMLIITSRTKEIGIRKVNGATSFNITAMIMKQFSIWIVIAFIIAGPVAWFIMSKWLESFAYKTEMVWWIYAISLCFTLLVALGTISYQTIKSALRNPVEALRFE